MWAALATVVRRNSDRSDFLALSFHCKFYQLCSKRVFSAHLNATWHPKRTQITEVYLGVQRGNVDIHSACRLL